MRKGFTLVEMLAVILILGVILLIGVPIYQGIQSGTNTSIYESKIANVKSKAEKYSSQTGNFIFDIKYMIEQGLLTPDNESGEYRDPRSGRNMVCDIVRIELSGESYYASIEEHDDCYNIDDLQRMGSIVKIYFYKSATESDKYGDGWIKGGPVYVGYEAQGDIEIKSVTWSGPFNNSPITLEGDLTARQVVSSVSLLNTPVVLNVGFIYNDQPYNQTVSRNVMIDNQAPYSTVVTNPSFERTTFLKQVEWVLSDGEGSGVGGYLLLNANDVTDNTYPCSSKISEFTDTDTVRVTRHLDNGTYLMCVKDKVGNVNDANVMDNKVVVQNVDRQGGDIKDFRVESKNANYNLRDVKIITELNDEDTTGYKMCISTSGYLDNCEFEEYKREKELYITNEIGGYGSEVVFYQTVKDPSGNISYSEVTYLIDALQKLDLNGYLNTEKKDNLSSYGTCDVYINNQLVGAGVTDYFVEHEPGTEYSIKNCKASSGYRYKGSTEISGTVKKATEEVIVPYVSLYTISYNMNGGSGSVASQTKEYGTNINLQTTNSTKAGYTYGGWNTNAAGTGTNYNAGASYAGNGNATLYAKWNPNTITVTLNNQSATSAGSSKVYYKYNANAYYSNPEATSKITAITKPTKTGYTFKGYYTNTNGGGTQYINDSGAFVNNLYKAFTSNTTLYANWAINSYTVTWNANGGSCNKSSSSHNYNTAIGTLPTCSRSGYAFQGWFTASSGGSKIATTTKVTGNVTYYAQWKATGLDVNNYNESKATLCDANKFKALINNDINRFKSGLDSQNFRNALYDCASVTEPILRSSDAAYAAIRANSRTRVVSGTTKGSAIRSCYLEKDYTDNVCTENDNYFATGNLYGDKVFVLGASTTTAVNNAYVDTSASGGGCNCDDTGWGECENSTSSKDCEFNAYIIVLDGNGTYKGSCSWGACNTSSNAHINPSSGFTCNDSGLRVGKFQNGVKGVLQGNGYQWYDNSSRDRNNIKYVAGTVYIEIFPI